MKFGINNCSEAKGLGIFAIHIPAVRSTSVPLPSGLEKKPFDFLE
jgi:hypothetical protein